MKLLTTERGCPSEPAMEASGKRFEGTWYMTVIDSRKDFVCFGTDPSPLWISGIVNKISHEGRNSHVVIFLFNKKIYSHVVILKAHLW